MTTNPTGDVPGRPVVHVEIIGSAPGRLREYFTTVFGWQFDTPSPVAPEVSDPEDYGFLDLIATADGTGVRGGVGGGPRHEAHTIFYVAVPDVEDALRDAERLGGRRVLGPVTSPNGLVIGQLTDPEGNLVGLAEVASVDEQPLDLFAGIPVRDFPAARDWYVRLFGGPPSFLPHDNEAVWELAGHRHVYIVARPEGAGHALHTIFVSDLDDRIARLADQGLVPVEVEHYPNGVRKAVFRDPDGNEIGFAGT